MFGLSGVNAATAHTMAEQIELIDPGIAALNIAESDTRRNSVRTGACLTATGGK